MPQDAPPPPDAPESVRERVWNLHPVVTALMLVIVGLHIWIWTGDNARINWWIETFAFWPTDFAGALAGSVEPVRPFLSLVTHAFLHGSWTHLAMNTAALIGLGAACVPWMGGRRYLVFFMATAAAGALMFAAIRIVDVPLVGASGALFGFLAALERVKMRQRQAMRLDWRKPLFSFLAQMAVLNAVLWFAMGGFLAWEAHLGGFIAGWFLTPWAAGAYAASRG